MAAPMVVENVNRLKVLELYSGIGGMHYALKEAGLNFEVVASIDINTVTNAIYKHNFPDTKLINKAIETVSLQQFNTLAPDMILMSPPCQPFVRVGKNRDLTDQRSKSFLYLLDIIVKLEKPVSYVLVENVKGFDTSDAHRRLMDTLQTAHYNIQEFLLSPLQCGIPNSRLRYFLLAKRKPLKFDFPTQDEIWTNFPDCAHHLLTHVQTTSNTLASSHSSGNIPNDSTIATTNSTKEHCHKDSTFDSPNTDLCHNDVNSSLSQTNSCGHMNSTTNNTEEDQTKTDIPLHEKYKPICRQLSHYLEDESADYFKSFLVPDKFFRNFWAMDIVKPDMRNSCCFTKRYAHHIEGAGSIIHSQPNVDLREFKMTQGYNEETHETVRQLQLRFFSPREIANLMHFPPKFNFPPGVSTIQCYRVLGNSLNVHVVAVLLQLLVRGD